MYVFLKLSSRSRHVFLPVRENLSSDVSRADEPHAENAMGSGVPVILPEGETMEAETRMESSGILKSA